MNLDSLGIVIAISFGTFSIVGVMLTLFLWNRGESNRDREDSQGSIESLRRDIERMNKRFHHLEKRKGK